MLNRKNLVWSAALLTILALIALASLTTVPAVAQGPAPQATAAPTQGPAPVVVLKTVGVWPNAADKNVITGTIKYITSTEVGEKSATVNMGTSGLNNVPVNVPVHVQASAADPKNGGKPTWTLTKPADSKAAIKDPAALETEFTPDVVGVYFVGVTLKNDAGQTSEMEAIQFHADTYIGNDATNCKTCHPNMVTEWSKTGHANILTTEIDNTATPDVATHYAETCIACHTTGYYLAPYNNNGGFPDAQAKASYKFPTFQQIDAAGKKTGPSNFAAMPDGVKAMANIQCEECHGPANDHVKNGAAVMDVSFDNAVCDACHAAGGHHTHGIEITYSGHSDASAAAFTTPTGPGEQACVRCHSGKGYVSFLANVDPKTGKSNQAAWNNEAQTIGCSTCHDPHSDANFAQLRVVGKPVDVPFTPKDVGLSATCEECHNGRVTDAQTAAGSTPHYSSASEQLTGVGGVTYGATMVNSMHTTVVGVAPVADPADSTGKTMLYGGNVPGPCVTCHMAPVQTDTKDPNYLKVGSHSFNTVSPDGKFDYAAACKSCHGAITDFNIKASADYDGNGKVEGAQDEIKGLLNVLWKAMTDKGVTKNASGYPYATLPKGADGKVDPKLTNAWINFRYVYGVLWGTDTGDGNQGKAAAIHNFKRSVQLLQLSYKDLTGSDVPGATLMK